MPERPLQFFQGVETILKSSAKRPLLQYLASNDKLRHDKTNGHVTNSASCYNIEARGVERRMGSDNSLILHIYIIIRKHHHTYFELIHAFYI